MEIISIIKGFVTNSSSANYWLNDEILKDEELKAYLTNLNKSNTSTIETSKQNQEIVQKYTLSQNTLIEETTHNFSVWFVYSLIMITVLSAKKIQKFKKNILKKLHRNIINKKIKK
jgi:hypothetical protein